ncbi:hypothetical protein ABZP36_034528 [Zizania latifolia]
MEHGSVTDSTASSFSIMEEDHTLANSVRFVLNQDPRVAFCGYSIPHPADNKVNIRVQTTGDSAKDVLKDSLQDLMVMCQHMSEDNQQLNYLKNEMVKTKPHSKAVEEALGFKTLKLQDTIEDNIIVRRKAREKLFEYGQQMKFVENFYHEQIERIHKETEEKESEFEKLLPEEQAKARQCDLDSGTTEDNKLRCTTNTWLGAIGYVTLLIILVLSTHRNGYLLRNSMPLSLV